MDILTIKTSGTKDPEICSFENCLLQLKTKTSHRMTENLVHSPEDNEVSSKVLPVSSQFNPD